jgi:hypothetical protein
VTCGRGPGIARTGSVCFAKKWLVKLTSGQVGIPETKKCVLEIFSRTLGFWKKKELDLKLRK